MSEEEKTWSDYSFFYGGAFSQWAALPIEVDGVTYDSNEQYMMAQKALLFEDYEMYDKIMASNNPEEIKMEFGRNVKNFDEAKWQQHAKDIVYKANYAKFTQNQRALQELAYSRGQEIVEASPTDKIWGIGIGEGDPRLLDKSQWQGTNWLGEAIMQVRDVLEKEGWFQWFDENDNFKYQELESGGNYIPSEEKEEDFVWDEERWKKWLDEQGYEADEFGDVINFDNPSDTE
jgi:hypothetical protein